MFCTLTLWHHCGMSAVGDVVIVQDKEKQNEAQTVGSLCARPSEHRYKIDKMPRQMNSNGKNAFPLFPVVLMNISNIPTHCA